MAEAYTEYMVEYSEPGSGGDWRQCLVTRRLEQAEWYIDSAPWPPESYRIMSRTVTVTPWLSVQPRTADEEAEQQYINDRTSRLESLACDQ